MVSTQYLISILCFLSFVLELWNCQMVSEGPAFFWNQSQLVIFHCFDIFLPCVFSYKLSLMGVFYITVLKCIGLQQSVREDHLEQQSTCIWCPALLWLKGPCILCSSYLFGCTFNWTLPLFTLLQLVTYYLFLAWWSKNYTVFTLESLACNFLYHILIHTIYMLFAGLNLI